MLKYVIIATAFLIATCAGYFSVSGIGHLFVGATVAAMVMAAALEIAKLVTVSFTYRYWNNIGRVLRGYFVGASMVLMSITSIGVYGYLSSAYAAGASDLVKYQQTVGLLEAQQKTAETMVTAAQNRLSQLDGIRNKQESRLDNTTSQRAFSAQTKTIASTDAATTTAQARLDAALRTRDSLAMELTKAQSSQVLGSKLGTFAYIAKAMGVSLDTIVKWFILAIVLVFDPLSVSLIIAYNFIVTRERTVAAEVAEQERVDSLPEWVPVTPKGVVKIPEAQPGGVTIT
jgi:hypothetical protein